MHAYIPYGIWGEFMKEKSWGRLKIEVISDSDRYATREFHVEEDHVEELCEALCLEKRFIILRTARIINSGIQDIIRQESWIAF